MRFRANLNPLKQISTPVNLTNHTYFNLAGHDEPRGILDHMLSINAFGYTETDHDSIPTGKICNHAHMDFTDAKKLEDAIIARGKAEGYSDEEIDSALKRTGRGGPQGSPPLGFDDNFCLNGFDNNQKDPLRSIAVLSHACGRRLEVLSTTPGVQLYTANYIDRVLGKSGSEYR